MMNSGADPTDSGRLNSTPSSTHATSTYKHKAKQKSLEVIVTQHHFPSDGHGQQHDGGGPDGEHDAGEGEGEGEEEEEDRETVGSLLADIANAISDTLRMLMFADKRHWASDEFEQVRALEDALDEAKADFQELGPLLKGTYYYENDRRPESLDELRELRAHYIQHGQIFKDWLRRGGPISPLWARDTLDLRRDLHRAQRRAAARIFASQQADIAGGGSGSRCLGAFEVYRRQRRLDDRRKEYGLGRRASRYESTRDEIARDVKATAVVTKKERTPSWKQKTPTMSSLAVVGGEVMEMGTIDLRSDGEEEPEQQQQQQQQQLQQYSRQPEEPGNGRRSPSLVDLVPACNSVGRFERFGDQDIAFSCDFCDGFIVWEDLHSMPAELDPLAAASGTTESPSWQARGRSMSAGEDKTVVFAPLAIANHISPDLGGWQARILCPYCDDYNYYEAGDEDETRYAQDERGFGSLKAFQEHLEWYHTSVAGPSLQAAAKNCVVM